METLRKYIGRAVLLVLCFLIAALAYSDFFLAVVVLVTIAVLILAAGLAGAANNGDDIRIVSITIQPGGINDPDAEQVARELGYQLGDLVGGSTIEGFRFSLDDEETRIVVAIVKRDGYYSTQTLSEQG